MTISTSAVSTEAAKTKLEQALFASSPVKLILMNYDTALASLSEAIRAIEDNRIEDRCNAVTRAIEAISDLYMSLDRKTGGDLAENLAAIYSYMIWHLPKINFKNDRTVAEEVIRLLKNLRSSWVSVSNQANRQLELHAEQAAVLAQQPKTSVAASGAA